MDKNVVSMAMVVNNKKMREQREKAKAEAEVRARLIQGRRRDARSHGYRGPLTRAEASRRALAALQD